MKIHITDKYIMTSDAHNFILNEVKIGKNGKSKGKIKIEPVGFYAKVSDLLQGLISHHMRSSTTRTLKTFLRELTAFHDDVRKQLKGI